MSQGIRKAGATEAAFKAAVTDLDVSGDDIEFGTRELNNVATPRPLRMAWDRLSMFKKNTCVMVFALLVTILAGDVRAQLDPRPSYRSAVELVSVTAVVRDGRGRLVPELTREDFQVFDGGESRPIINFWSDEEARVSVAVLLDTSGSMSVGSKMASARLSGELLLTQLHPDDEAAVYAFDTELRELESFTTEWTWMTGWLKSSKREGFGESLGDMKPYGATSLYDAIAETAHLSAARRTTHRAVVVFSDGIDTHSDLTAPEVSAIASSIDVPVYLVAVVSHLDLPDAPTAAGGLTRKTGRLKDLARWTGGRVFFVSDPGEAGPATTMLLNELRQQYVLAFEASDEPGWRLIKVRVPQRQVRTRSAYQARARD